MTKNRVGGRMIPKYTSEWDRGRIWRGDFAPLVFTVNPFDSYGD